MSFDANSFLSAVVTASNSTVVVPCPIGEYHGIIDKISPRQWQSKDGTKSGIALDVFWNIEDASVKQLLNRETIVVKQGIMLDLNAQGGLSTEEGSNVALGRLRASVGKNNPGEAFSFEMLPGLSAKVSVMHRPDPQNTENVFAEVKAVAPL